MDKTDYILTGTFLGMLVSLILMVGITTLTPKKAVIAPVQQIQRKCDDIIRYQDGRLVCEINIASEDSV